MVHNGSTPKMEIDAQTYEVRADGAAADLRAGDGAADGAALLPVLTRRTAIDVPLLTASKLIAAGRGLAPVL